MASGYFAYLSFYLYIFVDKYLNALSAQIATMFLPLASGLFAICAATFTAADADCPKNIPSVPFCFSHQVGRFYLYV